jgi:hypothetical protein
VDTPIPSIDVFVPDEFEHLTDEHGAHVLRPRGSSAFAPVDMRIAVDPVDPDLFGASVVRAVAGYRLTLSDAKVVHAGMSSGGFFGGAQRDYVIAYRAGIFAFSMYLWFVHLPEHRAAVTISGVCLAEDAPIFHPIFHLIARQSSLATAGAR